MSITTTASTRKLASFLAELRPEDVPPEAMERTEEFFLDWAASALASRGARPIVALERFAEKMGPESGPAEILVSCERTSPLFAALVNGASSHFVEQDDLHNASVFHPATVVFPATLAAAQEIGASGTDFLTASVVGYEAGVRVGSFLGRSHYKVFHTTGTAGTLAAAAAVSHLLGADEETMLHALGSAGTQAAGLWEFPARRRRLQTATHRKGRLRRPARRVPGPRRVHRRPAHTRRAAGDGRRHVDRRRSGTNNRRSRRALGSPRNLLQVPCLLPPHPPGRGRSATGNAGVRPESVRHTERARTGTRGGDRRTRACYGPADNPPVQVLDGVRTRPNRREGECRNR